MKTYFKQKDIVEIGKWKVDDTEYEYWIINSPFGALNGYAVFNRRPTKETGYHGILTYVPVHGGITFAEKWNDKMIYGFDTGHCDSNEFPINDKKWIKEQIEIMVKGILKAAELEEEYLSAATNEIKADICQKVLEINPIVEERYNFGVNINLLAGTL
jgi:hypothetical protein